MESSPMPKITDWNLIQAVILTIISQIYSRSGYNFKILSFPILFDKLKGLARSMSNMLVSSLSLISKTASEHSEIVIAL